jgi:ADP-ribose pyrophosphatase YjhB (NUDIX family)
MIALSSQPSYCTSCGHPLADRFVPDEGRNRLVCTYCGQISYVNPNVVAGVIPVANRRVWLLRRGIEPRLGAWTYPAGYMEMGETVEDAAKRETREELNLDVRIDRLLGVYSRPPMTTVVIVYVAEALSTASIGHETLEIGSFGPAEIPWDGLAFWSTRAALSDWVESVGSMCSDTVR